MRLRFLSIFLLFISAACQNFFEKEIQPDIGSSPGIALTSFLSPQDSVIQVRLIYTEAAVGTLDILAAKGEPVLDAEVILRDSASQKNIQLDYVPMDSLGLEGGLYQASQSQFPIVPGKTYQLNIQGPHGIRALASTSIPPVELDEAYFKYEYSRQRLAFDTHSDLETVPGTSLFVSWLDISGKKNYYGISRIQTAQNYFGILSQTSPVSIYEDQVGQSDGSRIYSEALAYAGNRITGDGTEIREEIRLSQLTFEYYEYHRTLREQTFLSNNPLSEPAPVYSNVEGAQGVFAGFNALKLKPPHAECAPENNENSRLGGDWWIKYMRVQFPQGDSIMGNYGKMHFSPCQVSTQKTAYCRGYYQLKGQERVNFDFLLCNTAEDRLLYLDEKRPLAIYPIVLQTAFNPVSFEGPDELVLEGQIVYWFDFVPLFVPAEIRLVRQR